MLMGGDNGLKSDFKLFKFIVVVVSSFICVIIQLLVSWILKYVCVLLSYL